MPKKDRLKEADELIMSAHGTIQREVMLAEAQALCLLDIAKSLRVLADQVANCGFK